MEKQNPRCSNMGLNQGAGDPRESFIAHGMAEDMPAAIRRERHRCGRKKWSAAP
ncbi:hypothetical protein LNP74_10210 [Klebsiella pneumoniae subsp. pneumoniae]|nr:hypothetical protein [Klebsiella pneumoniae subsp. pneumoniae]